MSDLLELQNKPGWCGSFPKADTVKTLFRILVCAYICYLIQGGSYVCVC